MTKTALENKKIAADLAKAERSAQATETASRIKAGSKDRATKESARQFDKEHVRKWHETGAKVADSAMKVGGTLGSVIASAINDPKFYLSIKGITDQIGSIPTFYPLGNVILNDFYPDPDSPGAIAGKHAVASVIALRYLPSFGKQNLAVGATSANQNSNLNLAMARFVTEARKMNSRIGEYEPGDAGQIMISATNIFERCAFIRKMLAVYNLVDSGRTRIAEAIFKASGLSFNLAERAECLYAFNFVAEKVNQALHVPEPFYYLERKIQLTMALYGDQDLRFGQYITVYKPDRMTYNEEAATVEVKASASSLSQMIQQVEDDLNLLQYSQVLTTFWADIRGAYSKAYTVQLATKQDKLVVKPVTEALTQVLNADLAPVQSQSGIMEYYAIDRLIDYESLTIRQDSSGFLYQGRAVNNQGIQLWDTGYHLYHVGGDSYSAGSLREAQLINLDFFEGYLNDNLLNFYQDNIDTSDIMVSSRLKPTFVSKSDNTMQWHDSNNNYHNVMRVIVDECGTEVPLWFYVEMVNYAGSDKFNELIITKFETAYKTGTQSDGPFRDIDISASVRAKFNIYGQFDWMPKYYSLIPSIKDTVTSTNEYIYTGIHSVSMNWQTGNLCIITPENLAVFHRAAILSEFTTPDPSQSFK